ncbi:MAG: 5-formyltetrahydrofolate cyclo-ligase, partial [Geminicoccaceae bacterium]
MREAALRCGITVLVPTPRCAAASRSWIRPGSRRTRSGRPLSRGDRFAEEVALAELPAMDAIVCGSVAVTQGGRRCGKGEGYGDLEYAILGELGHPPAPVVTTVHAVQIVGGLPRDPADLPAAVIVTPDEVIRIAAPPPAPAGIDWGRLSKADLQAMPCLPSWRSSGVAAEHSPGSRLRGRLRSVRLRSVRLGFVRLRSVRLRSVRLGFVRPGFVRLRSVRLGSFGWGSFGRGSFGWGRRAGGATGAGSGSHGRAGAGRAGGWSRPGAGGTADAKLPSSARASGSIGFARGSGSAGLLSRAAPWA